MVFEGITVSLTPKEAFRLGFLLKCAELGLAPAAIREKTAAIKQSLMGIGDAISTLGLAPIPLAALQIAGGAGLGIAGGYGAAKLLEEDNDPEIAKKYELIAAYRQQAERARRQASRLAYRQPTKPVRTAVL